MMAARVARGVVDSLLASNPEANIVLVGDFNDDPRNKSVKQVLNAHLKLKEDNQLFNTSYSMYKQGLGTLYYKGAYNLFDQVIVSQGLLKRGLKYQDDSFTIASYQYLTHTKGDFKGTPKRTFSKGQYLNGFSDHFPVFIVLSY